MAISLSGELAHAQTDEQRAGARAIATEGANAFKEGRYKDAVEMFSKAESLVHAPPHLLFLARSHAKLGQYVKAREAYLKIVKEQLPANAPVAFRDAQSSAADELKTVEPHIGSLVITVTGAESAKDLTLSIDGAPVSSVMVGVPLPMDPGTHELTASATGLRAAPLSITLKDAERQTATLALAPDANAGAVPAAPVPGAAPLTSTAAPPPTQAPAAPAADSDGRSSPVLAYVALGVGVVGLGAGTLFALQSKSKRSDADAANTALVAKCGALCSAEDPDAQHVSALDDSARSAKTLAIVSYAVGGVGVAAGITLLVLNKKHKDEAPASATLTPWLGLGSAGLRGSF